MMNIVFLNINRINYDKKLNLDNYSNIGNIKYFDNTTQDKIIENIGDAEIVVVKELKLDGYIINSLPNSVKLIIEAGTGYNNIDIEACKKRNIKVSNIPSYSTNTVALFTMMLILNMSVSFRKQELMLFNNDFSNFGNNLNVNYSEIDGKVLGIIGMGNIGKKVAEMASNLGMKVIYYSKIKDEHSAYEYVSLEELLTKSDYVSFHCSLNSSNYHMLNKENIRLMKKTAFIINTARGALIEEEALVNAIRNKQISGIALDVLEKEPIEKTSELLKFDNVIITPHMAWNSIEARERLLEMVFDTIDKFQNNISYNVVNE